jgi:hypothetical protein
LTLGEIRDIVNLSANLFPIGELMDDNPNSTRQTLKVYPLTRERLNEQCRFFRLSQDAMIEEALAAHLVVKGVTYDDITKAKLLRLNSGKRR